MNKKGQVLVLFILLIPVFLMLLAFVVDIGSLYLEDKKIESLMKETIQYGLKNIDDEDIESKMVDLLTKNTDNKLNINVNIADGYIDINTEKMFKGMFKFLFKNNIYIINNSYYGYIDENKFVIVKE